MFAEEVSVVVVVVVVVANVEGTTMSDPTASHACSKTHNIHSPTSPVQYNSFNN